MKLWKLDSLQWFKRWVKKFVRFVLCIALLILLFSNLFIPFPLCLIFLVFFLKIFFCPGGVDASLGLCTIYRCLNCASLFIIGGITEQWDRIFISTKWRGATPQCLSCSQSEPCFVNFFWSYTLYCNSP